MKFFVIATILATAIAVLAAAAPGIPVRGELIQAPTDTTLHARTDTRNITIELSNNGVNVGRLDKDTLDSSIIYDKVYHALQAACTLEANLCGTAKFETLVERERKAGDPNTVGAVTEKVTVSVQKAWWNGDKKAYFLLIGAVAGAFERGAWDEGNCRVFYSREGVEDRQNRHCNSAEYVAAAFPGQKGEYHMQVHFQGTSDKGKFSCEEVIDWATGYLGTLSGEIEAVAGFGDMNALGRCLV